MHKISIKLSAMTQVNDLFLEEPPASHTLNIELVKKHSTKLMMTPIIIVEWSAVERGMFEMNVLNKRFGIFERGMF